MKGRLFEDPVVSAPAHPESRVYTPTRLNGVPVPVLLTVTVRFVARK